MSLYEEPTPYMHMLFPHSMLNKSNKFVGSTWFSKGAVKVTPTKQNLSKK